MKGLCITSIFTSGSGSFPPVTNTNSDANNEQRENKIILIDNSTYSWEVDEITSISLSLSTEFKIKTCKECHTWHPTSARMHPLLSCLPSSICNWIASFLSPALSLESLLSLMLPCANHYNPHLGYLNPYDEGGGRVKKGDSNAQDRLVADSRKSLRTFIDVVEMQSGGRYSANHTRGPMESLQSAGHHVLLW